MAKKPGMMNDPKHIGGMNPLKVANLMAGAANIKVQKAGKPYVDDGDDDGTDEVNPVGKGDMPNAGKGGAQHPSAPPRQKSSYAGKMTDDMAGGADHPTSGGKKKNGKQIAAIKHKEGEE